jgi:O-antigen ligase
MVLILSVIAGVAATVLELPLLIGAIGAALTVIVIARNPFAGLLVYFVIFSIRLGELVPALAPLRAERIIGMLTFGFLVLHQVRSTGGIAFDRSRQTIHFYFFVLAAFLSIPLAVVRGSAIEGLTNLIKLLILYLLVVHLMDTRKRLRVFIVLYCGFAVFLATDSVLHYLQGMVEHKQGIDRAIGTTSIASGPNELGASMACMIPLFIRFAFTREAGWLRTVLFVCLGIMVTALILTGSRSGFIGFIAGLGYLAWGSRHRLALGLAGIVLVAGLFAVMPEQYQERYASITRGTQEGTGSERVKLWKKVLRMFVDHPVTGVGINCFTPANAYFYSTGRPQWIESHSLYIQVMSEMGLIGVAGFFSFLVVFMRLNRKTAAMLEADDDPDEWTYERALLQGMFAGFVALLFTGIFGHSMMRDTWYLYAALGLVVARLYLQARPEISEQVREKLLR